MSDIPVRKRKPRQAPGAVKHNERIHAEVQERRRQALQLRLRGANYSDIGRQLGVTEQSANRYVKDAIEAIPRESAEKVLALELEKLDSRELATQKRLLRPNINDGDFAKLQQVLTRISEQRAKLQGLYAAEKHEVSFPRVDVRSMTVEQKVRLANGDFGVLEEVAVAGSAAGQGIARAGANGAGGH